MQDLKIKLGAPNYPGDTMTFTGARDRQSGHAARSKSRLKGKNSMGNHVDRHGARVPALMPHCRRPHSMNDMSISGRAAIVGLGADRIFQ